MSSRVTLFWTLDERSRHNFSHVFIPSLLTIHSSCFFFASFLKLQFQFFFLFLHFRHRVPFLSFSSAHLLLFTYLHPILHVLLFLAFLLLNLLFLNLPIYNSPFPSTFLFVLFFIILSNLVRFLFLLILQSTPPLIHHFPLSLFPPLPFSLIFSFFLFFRASSSPSLPLRLLLLFLIYLSPPSDFLSPSSPLHSHFSSSLSCSLHSPSIFLLLPTNRHNCGFRNWTVWRNCHACFP